MNLWNSYGIYMLSSHLLSLLCLALGIFFLLFYFFPPFFNFIFFKMHLCLACKL